uniref:PiggyBac transposable element-derived protein 4 n=1 Tax=Lygus hesperus TaxID=30085 RepID=A0A0A9XHC0_LYGHE
MLGDELSGSGSEGTCEEEELPKDPLADSDDSYSQSSNEENVNDVYATFHNFSDQSFDESSSSFDSADDEPPLKKWKRTELKKSEKSYEWKKISEVPQKYTRIKSQDLPPSADIPNISTEPSEIFTRYFTDSFVSLIVKLTNLRAEKCSLELNLTECELKAFIGILIIMGFHRLPGISYYWKANANFGVPRVSSVMTVSRFLKILRFLSFNDSSRTPNKGLAKTDEFYNIRLLVDHLNEKFSDVMEPSKWLNINKSTVRPKILKTRHDCSYERKFSVTALCCAKTGYLFKLSLQNPKNSADEPEKNDDIVRDLLSVVKTEGCTVVFGQEYTNFPLVEELYSRNIFVCAELRRKCDPNVPSKFREGDIRCGDFVQSGDFSITAWRDTHVKKALILSTMHDPSEKKSSFKRKVNDLADYPGPVVDFYDNHKEGVKLFDIQRLRYNTFWKSRKCSTRFFYYILDATIVNSYILYKKSSEKIKKEDSKDLLSVVQFRSNLADGLIAGFVGRRRTAPNPQNMKGMSKKKNSSRTTSVRNSVRMTDVGSHMPTKTTCRRCAFCSTRGSAKRTTIMCTSCQVGLCLPCFAPFHELPQE